MAPAPTGPALVPQRLSIDQVDVDLWRASLAGDAEPIVLCEGPMASYEWFVSMMAMAAAAAAAKLAPAPRLDRTEKPPSTATDAAAEPEG